MDYNKYWELIFNKNEELNNLFSSYWHDYSNLGTWQFWTVVFLMIFPLILLYFTVDRSRIFEVFFFGYTVHILWSYTDLVLARQGYFVHTYFLTPLLPYALNMTASALPVAFLLVYQYTSNTKKNFYLIMLILCAVFAFGIATLEEFVGLLKFDKGMNQFHLFMIDIAIAFAAYWMTKLVKSYRVLHR
ncbi:hypothetical protein ACM26V_03250 [Salipaludibacillus sp. HK11]|uniref:hypothetical protein n=1 Tax=Salipaludibacillus sp. HK11 TaxID=3394320 RepID=UPI0039FCECBA